MKRPNQIGKIVYYSLILVLVLVIIFCGLQILESTLFKPTSGTVAPPSKTITRDGVEYFPRQDITVMLVMGIDEFGPMQSSGESYNPGAADMVTLLIFDEKNEFIMFVIYAKTVPKNNASGTIFCVSNFA